MGNNQTFLNSTKPPSVVEGKISEQETTTMEKDEDEECIFSTKNITSRISENEVSVQYYICGPLLTFFIVLGVLGNIFSVKVFMNVRRRTAAAINAYLIVLAGWDLSLLVTSFFLYNFSVLLNGYVPVYGDYVRSYPTFFSLANASHTATIWVVVCMAAERYFALCYPLKHRRCTSDHGARARTTLICVSVLSLLLSVPKFFEVHLTNCLDVDTGSIYPRVSSSELRRHQAYSIIYLVIGGLLFHSLAPFSILVVLSIRVIIEVRRGTIMHRQISVRRTRKAASLDPPELSPAIGDGNNRRCRRNSSKASTTNNVERSNSGKWSENKANEILPLAVIAKFFICHTMPTVLDIFERLMSEEDFEGPLVDLSVDISNLLVVVNSSVNFLLYAACSVHFRRKMFNIFESIYFCRCYETCGDDDDEMESRRSSALSPPISKKKKDSECIVREPLTAYCEP